MHTITLCSLALTASAIITNCEPVCEKLYCYGDSPHDVYMCNEKCCWDTEEEHQLRASHRLAKDYHNDVSRSPNCNWDMFIGCRE